MDNETIATVLHLSCILCILGKKEVGRGAHGEIYERRLLLPCGGAVTTTITVLSGGQVLRRPVETTLSGV